MPFPSPGDLPDPGIEPRPLKLQADSLTSEPQGSPHKAAAKEPTQCSYREVLACEMSAVVRYFEDSLTLPFFRIGIKTDIF